MPTLLAYKNLSRKSKMNMMKLPVWLYVGISVKEWERCAMLSCKGQPMATLVHPCRVFRPKSMSFKKSLSGFSKRKFSNLGRHEDMIQHTLSEVTFPNIPFSIGKTYRDPPKAQVWVTLHLFLYITLTLKEYITYYHILWYIMIYCWYFAETCKTSPLPPVPNSGGDFT